MEARRRFVASIAGAGAALLISAPVAFAAERFASPSGTSLNPCTLVAPCDIVTAINKAANKDDVTIEPGTYGPLSETLYDETHTLTIHGQAGTPRPVIIKSGGGFAILLAGLNSSLRDVEVDVSSANSFGIYSRGVNVSIERVISHVLGSESYACAAEAPVTMSNSLCVADGLKSYAFAVFSAPATPSATLRNDTLEAPSGAGSSGGVALWASASGGYHAPVTLINTIAHGANVDLLAEADSTASSEATIAAEYSNYLTDRGTTSGGKATVTPHGSGTNQTVAPQFVNTAMDDFHELAGSSTVGAGFGSPANGTLDLDGNPRQFGARTDIGAYQFIPPAAAAIPPAVIGAGAGAGASGGGGAKPAPSDSQPVLSPATFVALSRGPSVIARAKGTTISYTDTQAATTVFVVRRPAGKGVLANGKCIKPSRKHKGAARGKSCTRYTIFGSFSHADTAGANRFRFSGRVRGRALKPGPYQLVSAPTNAFGTTGATRISSFTIVSH